MLLKMTSFQRVLGGFDVIFGKVPSECGDFVVAFRCGIEFESPVSARAPPPSDSKFATCRTPVGERTVSAF